MTRLSQSRTPLGPSWLSRAVGVLAEGLLTAAVLVTLFFVWQLWWTDVRANAASARVLVETRSDFNEHAGAPSSAYQLIRPALRDGASPTAYPVGSAHAIVHLPSLDEVRPVREGVDAGVLDQGVLGHYPGTAAPGELGNYALAGHRTTYGRPLWDLDTMSPGDPVVVETGAEYHVYTFVRSRVVSPEETDVLAAVPDRPGAPPDQAWLVLTTCHPRFSAEQRLVGYAVLDRSVDRLTGPPPEIEGGGS